MSDVTRRQAIKGMAAAIPAVTLMGAKAAVAAAVPSTASLAGSVAALKSVESASDATVVLRNMFVNRCPMLTRLPWQPADGDRFNTFSHRYKTPAKLIKWSEVPPNGGLTTIGTQEEQYIQTFAYPVGSEKERLPGHSEKTIQLQNLVDDIETSIYFGLPVEPDPDNGVAGKMGGLKYQIKTNRTDCPENSENYKAHDFIRDTLQAARSNGGEPDLLVVSTNFMSGFATWGQAIQRVPAGETVFGTPIHVFEVPFLHGVTLVESPLLTPYTAICLTSSEVMIRNETNPQWRPSSNPEGIGEWYAKVAVQLINEHHHAFVSGIKKFAE